MKHSLMVGVYVTEDKKYIVQLKDYSVLLLNDREINFHDKPIESISRNRNIKNQSVNDKKCMNKHIKVVYQLSKLVKCNKENQQMEKMYVERERGRSILSYVGFSKKVNVITSFP